MNTHTKTVRFGWLLNDVAYPRSSSIATEFLKLADKDPDAIAVAEGRPDGPPTNPLSYRELADRSARLARVLIERGVKPGDRVGFATDRTCDLIVAMLGILRAGAAYVPIDLAYPKERINYLIEDSRISAFVASAGLEQHLNLMTMPVVAVDSIPDSASISLPDIDSTDAAYVIYTSGSTGKPKGVVTPHRAVLRLTKNSRFATLGSDRRILQLAPVSFDAATFEIWGALLNGGMCIVHPDTGVPDLACLKGVLSEARINTLWLTSSLFNTVVDAEASILDGVDELLVGGEALSVPHVRKAYDRLPDITLINGYGPTETTTFACTYRIPRTLDPDAKSVPIGRPIGNTAVAIVDDNLAPVKDGHEGELVIAGDGLAIGYQNRPDLTEKRFVAHKDAPDGRFYRTGDIVRLGRDGEIRFTGRRDTQVKVAGHRIELGEIEHLLKSHPDIADAAAAVEGTGNDARIAAWIVPVQGTDGPRTCALQQFAGRKLPPYMVPAILSPIDALPLTRSGKLDRRALCIAKRRRPALDQPYSAPRGKVERFVAKAWATLIGIETVGRHDRFFELGGTSLLAMRFLEICRSERNIDLSTAQFFDFPTVENVARLMEPRADTAPTLLATVSRDSADDRIAIIGVAGRFSGAEDVPSFWDMLLAGGTGRVDISAEDLEAAGLDPALLDDPDYVPAAYPLKDAEGFDADFFGFTPREAQLMDPQQRIMLECAWNALEDAGHDPKQSTDRVGVFGGVGRNGYLLNNLMSHKALRDQAAEYNMLIGNERDFPCSHISFRLGLTGPAITVQTACSTSGVAIHLAAESLRRGECEIALAGGAKVLVPNRAGYHHTEGGPVSPDGYIRAFDAGAGGMVRGSGCAMVALKPLTKALEDGDNVYGVIIASAVNNDGAARAGFTAPSAIGQAEVIAETHVKAGIDSDTVTMIEAHGTGTVLGDPIEIEGLNRAFRSSTSRKAFCAIGSVKTNIGHLDAGATAAGLIKTVLSLKNELIPPTINFDKPNPRIGFADTPFYVAADPVSWKRGSTPRRAGVSSFGLGGTNAHILVEEAPLPALRADTKRTGAELLAISARTDAALAQRCADLADRLERDPEIDLSDAAHTLRIGRRRFEKRLAMLVSDRDDAIAKLRAMQPRDRLRTALTGDAPPVAFLFAGIGAQYAGMGQALYEAWPVFRETLDRCCAHFSTRTGQSLKDAIFATDTVLEDPVTAFPALLAVEYASARLWQSWGVQPAAMIGHSMGEYTAACIAGVFSVEDAMDIVIARGRLFATLEPGGMLGVPLSEAEVVARLGPDLSLAAVNRSDQCVVSGPVRAIEAFAKAALKDGIETRRVHIDVATHSSLVEPILDAFGDEVRKTTRNRPSIPFLSSLTGDWITDGEATDPEYWVRHLRGTVRFADGIERLLEDPERIFLESGPGQTLATLTRQNARREAGHEVIATIRHPQENIEDCEFLLGAVGRYWLAGGEIDWSAFSDGARRRVSLPGYPFERQRHWIDAVPYAATDEVALSAPETDGPDKTAGAFEDSVAEPATRREKILAQLKAIIHQLSGLPYDRIDEHTTFLELGFDSLFLTQANAAFKKAFKVKLTTRQLIENTPVLDQLAGYLDDMLDADAVIGDSTAPADPAASRPDAAKAKRDDNPGLPSVKKTQTELTPEQDAHIESLIAETNRRTPKAKAATQGARGVLADPRTVQGFRSRWKEMIYPVLSDRAKGSKVWDTDDNEYIDLVGGYGVTFFGHRPDFIVDAIKAQLDQTLAIGPQSVLAGEVATLVSDMTGMERVAFCNTGSEAVLAAIRMARTATGRSKIVRFDGHYHGIFDELQTRGVGEGPRLTTLPAVPGIPAEAIENTIVVKFGDPESFDVIREKADDIALVLVEPVRSRNPDYQPRDYLHDLRKVTEQCDIPLLFDEIVTGFRSHPGGAQAIFGVRADLATYGKVAGGGLPIGIVAGGAQFMDTLDGGHWNYGDDSVPTSDMTSFAGTFVRHPMALASTRATLEHLKAQGPDLQERLNARSARLAADLNAIFSVLVTPIRCEQFASVLMITFTKHQEYSDLLFFHLRNRGIMTYEGRPIFLTTAHTEEDCDRVVRSFGESLRELIAAGLIDGHDPDAIRRIPMSPGQQEIWVTAQFSEEASCAYNLCSTLELEGSLDLDLLKGAIQDLAVRHEALRAVPVGDGLTQTIHPQIEVPITVEVLAGLDSAARDSRVDEMRQAQVTRPFDLARGPLVRAQVLVLERDIHLLLLTAHHVIADGWSCGVMVKELGELYAARRDGRAPDLPAAQQLGDYVAFLRQADQRDARDEARDYWVKVYEGGLPRVDFPTDRPRPRDRNFRSRRVETDLDSALVQDLRRVAKDNGTTLFACLISGFAAYLGRLTGARDIPIGFSAAGQPLLGGKSLVGHCVNFMPLRVSPDPDAAFSTNLKAVSASVLDALEHQNFDFVSFVQEVRPPRDGDWAPLVPIGVNLDPSTKGVSFGDLEIKTGSVGRAYENLDMFLDFAEIGERVELQCTFNVALFDEETIRRRMGEYLTLLSSAAANPERPLSALEIMTPDVRTALLGAKSSKASFPREAGLPELFRAVAKTRGSHPAVRLPDVGEAVSYGELDERSDTWAARLYSDGVRKGDFVALLVPRSAEFIVAVLAILKAGAAYVPIDPDTPPDRIRFMLEDSGAKVLMTVGNDAGQGDLPPDVAVLDVLDTPGTSGPAPRATLTGGDVAYLMYTSGSTGTPKGVQVPHRAVARLVIGQDYTNLGDSTVTAMLAPVSFDASTFEIWGPLLNGGSVAVMPGTGLPDLSDLSSALETGGVTTLWLTAALFNTIIDLDPQILSAAREVLTGGETVSPSHVARAYAALPGVQIINGYGPTEGTTFSCAYRIPRESDDAATAIPIGRPIAGTQIYILDQNMLLLPPGTPGEIVVGGEGLALGYWKREELSDAAFVPDTVTGAIEARLYRTGDIGRIRPDGLIEFLGRRDDQVKIRGFRIEPAEIEVVLANCTGIDGCGVVYSPEGGGVLVACFVSEVHGVASVRKLLRDQLPRHLVPQRIVKLDTLPVTANGKLDRAKLVDSALALDVTSESSLPETTTEWALIDIWRDVLKHDAPSVTESFFDLGGHSLMAVRLFDLIRRRFGPDLPISTLFAHPTVRDLAEEIDRHAATDPAAASARDDGEEWDTSIVMHEGPDTRAKPLFIVGGAGGNLNNLVELAQRIGQNRPVIGFQTRGILGHRMRDTIEEMAAEHIRHLGRHQKVGPYILAGYSAGAQIAFEMARQLAAAGEEVSDLVLIDAYAPGFASSMHGDDPMAVPLKLRGAQRLRHEVDLFADKGMAHLVARMKAKLGRTVLRGRVLDLLEPIAPPIARSRRTLHHWLAVARKYEGGPYAGQAALVMSRPSVVSEKLFLEQHPLLGWESFIARNQIETIVFGDDHHAIVEGDDAARLAAFVETRLDRVR